ncbi:MAG: hypothetical protein COS57_13860 [Syntrophobacterales bacterium CG03_land_8_20_14_0_80_58_14]|nr:MAG: hypothetical protein COS57_13860 [Syntrophobacterales bacterium CG03_land_8_20_14_0_80_58_14]
MPHFIRDSAIYPDNQNCNVVFEAMPECDKGWINELVQEAMRINRMNRFYEVVTFFDHGFIAKISSMTPGRFGWLKLSPDAVIR